MSSHPLPEFRGGPAAQAKEKGPGRHGNNDSSRRNTIPEDRLEVLPPSTPRLSAVRSLSIFRMDYRREQELAAYRHVTELRSRGYYTTLSTIDLYV